jgi:hypothetical protein
MTVISAIITRHCTAHASDSFITVPLADGKREVVKDRQSKLVRVDCCKGAAEAEAHRRRITRTNCPGGRRLGPVAGRQRTN